MKKYDIDFTDAWWQKCDLSEIDNELKRIEGKRLLDGGRFVYTVVERHLSLEQIKEIIKSNKENESDGDDHKNFLSEMVTDIKAMCMIRDAGLLRKISNNEENLEIWFKDLTPGDTSIGYRIVLKDWEGELPSFTFLNERIE